MGTDECIVCWVVSDDRRMYRLLSGVSEDRRRYRPMAIKLNLRYSALGNKDGTSSRINEDLH